MGRFILLAAAGIAVATILAIVLARGRIREELLIYQVESADEARQVEILEKFAEIGSARGLLTFAVSETRKERIAGRPDAWNAFERALKRIGPAALLFLLGRLSDPGVVNRRCAVHALGLLGNCVSGAIPALEAALDDPDEHVRILAGEAIDKIKAGRTSR